MLEFESNKPLTNESSDQKLVPKRVTKSIKNQWKSSPGSSGAFFADPGDPYILKMSTQGPKNESRDPQNVDSGSKKWVPRLPKSTPEVGKIFNQILDSASLVIQYQTNPSNQTHQNSNYKLGGPAAGAKP